MAAYAEIFRALADERRQVILEMLGERQMAAGEIAAAFDITQPAVSHHLNVLRQAGLVTCRRDGQRIIYALESRRLNDCWRGFFKRLVGTRKAGRARAAASGVPAPREGGDKCAGKIARRRELREPTTPLQGGRGAERHSERLQAASKLP